MLSKMTTYDLKYCLCISDDCDSVFYRVNAKSVIEVSKKGVSATNPSVRTAAISLLGVLYLYMGPSLHMFFENEKPALKQQINAEFDKYDNMKPPDPIRGLSKSKSESADNLDEIEDSGEKESEPAFNPQDLLPRVDISNQITEALINELSDKNWKVCILSNGIVYE